MSFGAVPAEASAAPFPTDTTTAVTDRAKDDEAEVKDRVAGVGDLEEVGPGDHGQVGRAVIVPLRVQEPLPEQTARMSA